MLIELGIYAKSLSLDVLAKIDISADGQAEDIQRCL